MQITIDTTNSNKPGGKEVRTVVSTSLVRLAIPMASSFARTIGAIIMQAANEIDLSEESGRVYLSEEVIMSHEIRNV